MSLDLLYQLLVDSTSMFLGAWVAAILTAGFLVFKGDISAAAGQTQPVRIATLKSSPALWSGGR